MGSITDTYFQENALLYRLRSGDHAAFNKIIVHFGGDMNIVAFGILRHAGLANELVRELFIRLQKEHYKNAEVPIKAYLYREVRAASERAVNKILEDFLETIPPEPENR